MREVSFGKESFETKSSAIEEESKNGISTSIYVPTYVFCQENSVIIKRLFFLFSFSSLSWASRLDWETHRSRLSLLRFLSRQSSISWCVCVCVRVIRLFYFSRSRFLACLIVSYLCRVRVYWLFCWFSFIRHRRLVFDFERCIRAIFRRFFKILNVEKAIWEANKSQAEIVMCVGFCV